ncbi:MAG: hypothetical protein HY520_01800 [Candidatus Aenigmarchaeota archaeon]|nr:hypothetical protein [Candidatus Aenigmarchaeota archaeon]
MRDSLALRAYRHVENELQAPLLARIRDVTYQFAQDGGSGLFLVVGPRPVLGRMANKLNGRQTKAYAPFNPVLYHDQKIQELFREAGAYDGTDALDGALFFTEDGSLISSGTTIQGVSTRGLEHVLEEVLRVKGRNQTDGRPEEASLKHTAGAYASTLGAVAFALSETAGTGVLFQDGRIDDRYSFNLHTPGHRWLPSWELPGPDVELDFPPLAAEPYDPLAEHAAPTGDAPPQRTGGPQGLRVASVG